MDLLVRPVSAPVALRLEARRPAAQPARPTKREWTATYAELRPFCGAAFLAHLLAQIGERRSHRRTPAHARYQSMPQARAAAADIKV